MIFGLFKMILPAQLLIDRMSSTTEDTLKSLRLINSAYLDPKVLSIIFTKEV